MKNLKTAIWHIILISLWINISETLRWILFSQSHFMKHYQSLNLVLPLGPLVLLFWLIWGVLLSAMIYFISEKFSLLQSTFMIWIMAFLMFWLGLYNLDVLPVSILWLVIPLSFISVLVGVLISNYLRNKVK
jgi:hypothetical protein